MQIVARFVRAYRVEIAIFALALIVRLAFLGDAIHVDGSLMAAIGGPDGYTSVSQNLIDGHGLSDASQPPYTPYSFRPPLYHFFIVASYFVLGGWAGVILLQIVLGSLVPILGMKLASYYVERRGVLIAAGIFLALEPAGVLYSTFLYSETLFTCIFLGSIWAFSAYLERPRYQPLVLSALLMGCATLVRPTAEFLPVIFLIVFLLLHRREIFSRRVLMPIGVYAILFVAVLSPWLIRNYVTFGVAGISPQTGVNLYTTLLPSVLSIDNGTTFQTEFAAQREAGIHGPNQADITEGREDVKLAIPLLLQHPKGLMFSAMNSAWSFFVLDDMYDVFRHVDIHPPEIIGKPSMVALFTNPGAVVSYLWRNAASIVSVIVFMRLVWIALFALFVYGAWRLRHSVHGTLAILIVLYFMLTSLITGFGLTARYRVPVNPLIVPIAFVCLGLMSRIIVVRNSKKLLR